MIGGKPYTSVEALQRFAEQSGGAGVVKIRTPAARRRAILRAEDELEEAGI